MSIASAIVEIQELRSQFPEDMDDTIYRVLEEAVEAHNEAIKRLLAIPDNRPYFEASERVRIALRPKDVLRPTSRGGAG